MTPTLHNNAVAAVREELAGCTVSKFATAAACVAERATIQTRIDALEAASELAATREACGRCECETHADDLQDGVCVECLDPTRDLQRCGTCFDLLLGETRCPHCDAESH